MKKFLIKILVFSLVVTLLFLGFLTIYLIRYEAYIDSNYARLTHKHNEGLVIGTSRAAIDIEPSIINDKLYNFSFTIDVSPFDNSYVQLIKKYHETQTFDSNRVHIVTVDPWALSSVLKYENLINHGFTSKLKFPISNPNYEYVLRFCNLSVWEINNIILNSDRNLYINQSGRLVKPMTEEFLNNDFDRKLKVKINNYLNSDSYKSGEISKGKIKNLEEIIEFLQKDGRVYLIRLPIHKEMLKLEDKLDSNFNSRMNELSGKHHIKYLNLMNYSDSIRTTDGHHIWDQHVSKFTTILKRELNKN